MKSLLLALVLVALPVTAANAPELEARDVKFHCDDKVCMVTKEDFAYMVNRDAILVKMLNILADKAKACNFKAT